MLFSSYEYFLILLPISLIIYFALNSFANSKASRWWLVLVSLFFYGWWSTKYIPLLLGSMIFNFYIGRTLSRPDTNHKRSLLVFGIIVNLSLLGYFKYVDFLISNINFIAHTDLQLLNIVLPLGISFFTFTQTAYLVDAYKGETTEYNFQNYALFVTFFPHLIAGPILHHKEIVPQFEDKSKCKVDWDNIAVGMFVFALGMCKKVVVADTFALWANYGFDQATALSFVEAWITSISYTMQLYFDFSGYTDMALGAAIMFNIRFPQNFNSPYRATNIQDFWRRWHITLSRFLRDYLYIPLGGNRTGEIRLYANLLITFILGGLWHGAAWTFVIWGGLHGFALCVHRLWQKTGIKLNNFVSWFVTFNFVNIAWIFFRAKDLTIVKKVLVPMLNFKFLVSKTKAKLISAKFLGLMGKTYTEEILSLAILAGAIIIVFTFRKNTDYYFCNFSPTRINVILAVGAIFLSIMYINTFEAKEFLYYDF